MDPSPTQSPLLSESTDSDRREAHRETRFSLLLLLAVCVALFLASRGTFRSAMLFPLVFAGISSVLALRSLLKAKSVDWRLRIPLAIVIIVVAAAVPVVHIQGVLAHLEATERHGMERLGGHPAPAIDFVHAFGPELRDQTIISDFDNDRLTLVNFWATWCGPCVAEIPTLEAAWQELRGKGLDIVGVTRFYGNGDRAEIAEIEAFLHDHDVTYPVVVESDDRSHRDYQVASLPSSILVDRQGRVIGYGAGIVGTERLLETARELLGEAGGR
jgi:thiol-disulfide isomerase/thioredoxin